MVAITQFSNCYRNKKVLVTGHTGFKGSWLALWLESLGAEVFGLSLEIPTDPAHWDLLKLNCNDMRCDIRNYAKLLSALREIQPEIIFHLAAQSLVRRSYKNPLETWEINVIGTANLLQASRNIPTVKAIVVATSDKCYENREWEWGYREVDPLGGYDPYSSSKAATEILVMSYRRSYLLEGAPLVATARAGNVIGGGDWSEDRLIPDIIRSYSSSRDIIVREPRATRPWQHVLEPLAGYLLLGKHLLEGDSSFADAWNFGPGQDANRSVSEVVLEVQKYLPVSICSASDQKKLHEANFLYLDSAKANQRLKWKPVWHFEKTIEKTIEWYSSHNDKHCILSYPQLKTFIEDAHAANLVWSSE